MDAVSPGPALAALTLALGCIALLLRHVGAPPAQGRFIAIDGLRGYLAFGVFLHHACIWYFYAHGGRWQLPPSALYRQFGETGVALFFMITAFLFGSKLLDGRKRPIDWLGLYVSRVLRLLPLYLFALLLLAIIVAMLSHWTLRESPRALLGQWMHWLLFTFFWAPDVNGVADTRLVLAGVVWTLRYEWVFYFCLPLLALAMGLRAPLPALLLALGVVGWGVHEQLSLLLIAPFVSGIIAALLVRSAQFCRLARSPAASLLCLLSLGLLVLQPDDSRALQTLALQSLAFALIAGGNTLFGALSSAVSRLLGEMAYSLYLLHGLLLFVAFRFGLGLERAAGLSALQHWLFVLALVPLLLLLCYATFRLIEQPAMRQVGTLTIALRRWLPASLTRGTQA